jgi:hypothetical protein
MATDTTATTDKKEPLDYSQDPKRDYPALIVRKEAPFNAEPTPPDLVKNYITPEKYFFCRNHGPLPDIKEEEHVITIQGIGCTKPSQITLKDIKQNYEKTSVMMVMQVKYYIIVVCSFNSNLIDKIVRGMFNNDPKKSSQTNYDDDYREIEEMDSIKSNIPKA